MPEKRKAGRKRGRKADPRLVGAKAFHLRVWASNFSRLADILSNDDSMNQYINELLERHLTNL